MKERWKAFQRLSHDLQASEIDELLLESKERELTLSEHYLIQQWDAKRNITKY